MLGGAHAKNVKFGAEDDLLSRIHTIESTLQRLYGKLDADTELPEVEDIEKIMDQIKKDVEFFKKFNLMDYSLLLAIERNTKASRRPSGGKSDQISWEGPQENFLEAHLQNSK